MTERSLSSDSDEESGEDDQLTCSHCAEIDATCEPSAQGCTQCINDEVAHKCSLRKLSARNHQSSDASRLDADPPDRFAVAVVH